MKLYKALKLRKKVVGEITKLKAQIQIKNSYLVGSLNAPKYNIRQLEEELSKKIQFLVELKYAINVANDKIQKDIYLLSEFKAFINLFESMDVTEGKGGRVGLYEKEIPEYKVQIDEKERDMRVKELQDKVDALQEKIDVYNHTTELECDVK